MTSYEQMRVAITKAEAVIDGTRMMVLQGQEYDLGLLDFDGALEMLRSAIGIPRRNCDVGTPEEQAKRMDAYCASHGERIGGSWRCDNCPLCSIDRCDLVWAQMPYTAEEGAGK